MSNPEVTASAILFALLLSGLAGLSTTIGSFIGLAVRKPGPRFMTLALGFLQVWFGFVVSVIKYFKLGDAASALCLNLPWIVGLPSVVLMGLTWPGASQPRSILNWIGVVGSIGSAVAVIALAGHPERRILVRIAQGAYALYGATGLLGDVLSYSRLMAFALATTGIALVVNTLGAMVREIPYVGIPAAVLVLVFGHLFNIAINSFGGFVHSARLQFIEFFGKFYEGGGRPFRPFAPETKYVEVE